MAPGTRNTPRTDGDRFHSQSDNEEDRHGDDHQRESVEASTRIVLDRERDIDEGRFSPEDSPDQTNEPRVKEPEGVEDTTSVILALLKEQQSTTKRLLARLEKLEQDRSEDREAEDDSRIVHDRITGNIHNAVRDRVEDSPVSGQTRRSVRTVPAVAKPRLERDPYAPFHFDEEYVEGRLPIQRGTGFSNIETKVAPPESFDGDTTKLEGFIHKLRMVFKTQKHRFPTEESQVNYAISYLTGNASDIITNDMDGDEDGVLPAYFFDFPLFCQVLRDHFGDPDAEGTAQAIVEETYQTGTILQYLNAVGPSIKRLGWNDRAIVMAVKTRVNSSIQYRLTETQGYRNLSWNEFKKLLIDLDRQEREKRGIRKANSSEKKEKHDSKPKDKHPREKRVETTVQRTVQRETVRSERPYVSPDEMKRRKETDSCLYCGKPGHYSRDCPEKKGNSPNVVKGRAGRRLDKSEWIPFTVKGKDPLIEVGIIVNGQKERVYQALLDSGASQNFVSPNLPVMFDLPVQKYQTPEKLLLLDGRISDELITSYTDIEFWISGNGPYKCRFDISTIGNPGLILGLDFFTRYQAEIDWGTCEMRVATSPTLKQIVGGGGLRMGRATLDDDEKKWAFKTLNLEEHEYEEVADLRTAIPESYHDYLDIFMKKHYESLPPHREYDHPVDLIDGQALKKLKVYPLNAKEDAWLKAWIDKSLAIGHIEPSSHYFGSPVFLVAKKTGDYRMVTDFRVLNNATVKNTYPLPRIDTLLERVRLAKFFTKLDMPTSYQLLRMRPGDEKWTTILTRYGAFQSKVMREGMSNAGASFQFFMNDLFHELLDKGVIVYIDDILIYANTQEELHELTKAVFKIIRQNDLYLKPTKCEFLQERITFLGFVVGHNQVGPEQGKLDSVESWPTPRNIKDIQRFLGFAGFYRRFIYDYAGITKPMTKLTRKNTPWVWGEEEDASFNGLKRAFASSPVLAQFDPDLQCYIETDASNCAIAAIASQRFPKGDDSEVRPTGFFSRSLQPAEANYPVHDKELLAVIEAFKHWKANLIGMVHPIIVLTDHKNLEYFMSGKPLVQRQGRWAAFLSDFNFKIRYRPGEKGEKPDALTRRSDYHPGKGSSKTKWDLNPTVLLPEALFENFQTAALRGGNRIRIDTQLTTIDSWIRTELEKDAIREEGLRIQVGKDNETDDESTIDEQNSWSWTISGLLLYQGRVVVPDSQELKNHICKSRHDSMVAGHPGATKTIALIKRDYYWPKMDSDIKLYVSECPDCQRNKPRRHRPYGELKSLDIPNGPWEDISMDFVVGFPKIGKMDAIWNIVDRFTKQAHFVPIPTTITARGLAGLFKTHIFRVHGIPRSILSDRDSKFTSKFWEEFCELLGIERKMSTAFHPQTDGQTERTNQVLEHYLRQYCNYNQDDWEALLPLAEFCYNNNVHESTGTTPFFANYGYHPRFDIECPEESMHRTFATTDTDELKRVHDQLKGMVAESQKRAARYFNAKHDSPPEFHVGDKVLVRSENIKTKRPLKKLDDKFYGPWRIKERISTHAYRVALPASLRVHNVFHVDRLELFRGNRETNHNEPESDDQFVVEAIIDSRKTKDGKIQYHVKWEGYHGPEATTWEPSEHLETAREHVSDFHQRYPKKPIDLKQIDSAWGIGN